MDGPADSGDRGSGDSPGFASGIFETADAGARTGRGSGAKKKRSSRSSKKTSSTADSSSTSTSSDPSDPSDSTSTKKKSTRRGKRGGVGRRSAGATEGEESREDAPRAETVEAPEKPARRSRKKSSSSTSSGKSDKVAAGDDKPARKKATRKRSSRRSADVEDDAAEDAGSDTEAEASTGRSRSKTTKSRAKTTKRRGSKTATKRGTKASEDEDDEPTSTEKRPTRRRKSARERDEGQDDGVEASEAKAEGAEDEDEGEDEDGTRRRRRRGRRGGRRRKSQAAALSIEILPGEEDDLPELPELPEEAVHLDEDDEASGGKRRSKRGSKKKVGSKKTTKKAAKKRSSKKDRDKDDEPSTERGSRRKKAAVVKDTGPPNVILVNAVDEEEKRVAVVCEGRIQDLQMTVQSQFSLVNDIYRGRVVNLEPAIGAAFVDFGQGRNGFLHTSDVLPSYGDDDWSLEKLVQVRVDPEDLEEGARTAASPELTDDDDDEDDEEPKSRGRGKGKKGKDSRRPRSRARPRLPITNLLKKGQMTVVQVTKEAIGDKGPTLTTYISIPGRYLVLMPTISRIGVSRKIEDEKERRRLKRILQSLSVPDGMGVIVRTAGVGHTKMDIKRDLEYLLHTWDLFEKNLSMGRGPSTLYQESDLAIRTLRDFFTEKTEAVYVDDPNVYEQLRQFAERLMPESVDRIKKYEGPRPLFHTHGVEQDFEKIFSRRVELPSGGSIVFDQTEALVAIDVNSGKTRADGFDFEKIALKTNLEAVEEVARQIRLRDLGGIVVIDFIDMMRPASMRQVERAFRTALTPDRARSKVGRISQFGLLELTRQRLGPGITKKLFHPCPRCRGIGRERNEASRASAILRRLGSALTLKGFSKVEVRAHPEVIEYLDDHCADQLKALEHLHDRELILKEVPEQVEDSVLRYLRADGREVRPGGRRKR